MDKLELKYGCNPNQKPACIFVNDGRALPVEVLNGRPGYINFMDALNSWQLVRELREAAGKPAAASFKHVSPAGAAVGGPLTDLEKTIYFVDMDAEISDVAAAYIRARGTDRLCSYGDWAAVSDICDESLAMYLSGEVSDGEPLPSFEGEPVPVRIDCPDAASFAEGLWASLDAQNKVSLYVRYIDIVTGASTVVIKNKNQ